MPDRPIVPTGSATAPGENFPDSSPDDATYGAADGSVGYSADSPAEGIRDGEADDASGGLADASGSGGGPGATRLRRWAALAGRLSANRMVRIGFVVLAVGLGGYAVARQWHDVRAGLRELGWLALIGSLLAVLAGLAATMQIWRVLLTALGSPLTVRTASRIFFIGQLGKYIPGSMWAVVVQMELAQAAKVPRSRTATAAILTLVASVCAGLLAGLVCLPFLPADGTAGFRWAFLAVPVLLVALHPKVVNAALGWLLRLARRPPLPRPLPASAVVAAMAWAVASWLLLGLHVWLLTITLGAPVSQSLALTVGGFAFAWAAGFLVFLAPAGAGVRELILLAVLAPVLSIGDATAVTLVSRVLMTGGDLILAGVAVWLAGPRSLRRTPTREAPTT